MNNEGQEKEGEMRRRGVHILKDQDHEQFINYQDQDQDQDQIEQKGEDNIEKESKDGLDGGRWDDEDLNQIL